VALLAVLAPPGPAPVPINHGPQAQTGATPPVLHVVALGDSVPSGAACSCDPFPALYGRLLSRRTGTEVTVVNDGTGGLDTGGLLDQLHAPQVVGALHLADVVLVTIGANDFLDRHEQVVEGTCSTDGTADCASEDLASMRGNLTSALTRIRTLRQGQPTTVLVTGYWNVFEDGATAQQASGSSGVQASIDLPRSVNAAIRAVSTAAGAQYVDLFGPFQSHRDIDSLLAADGDHPDAAGHQLIAKTLVEAGLPGLLDHS
jgi:lysophospholipase L1-like esterase